MGSEAHCISFKQTQPLTVRCKMYAKVNNIDNDFVESIYYDKYNELKANINELGNNTFLEIINNEFDPKRFAPCTDTQAHSPTA